MNKNGICYYYLREIKKDIFELQILKKLFCCLTYFLKVNKNKIVFNQFDGSGYSGNPKYICEKFLSNSNLELYWLVKDRSNVELPNGVTPIQFYSFKSLYHLMTASIWISNVHIPFFLIKKKNQTYMQTWHGGLGFKDVEKSVKSSLSYSYNKISIRDSKHTDIYVSNSHFLTNVYRNSFWYCNKILEVGYPRNDILVKKKYHSLIKEKVLNRYSIKSDSLIILYAPTFRKEDSQKYYINDYDYLIQQLEHRLKKNVYFLVRFHPNIRDYKISNGNDKIINVSMYMDIQELLIASDMLVSDFSSLVFDYTLLERQIILYIKDLEEYKSDRKLLIDVEEFPVAKVDNEKDLLLEILHGTYETEKITRFLCKYGVKDFGTASQCIYDYFFHC